MTGAPRGSPPEIPPRQLAFAWPHEPDLSRARFVEGAANGDALGAVDAWRNWPGGIFLLVGETGSGKTHLAHIWSSMAGARRLRPDSLHEALEILGPDDCTVLELPGGPGVEERGLLHLLNHVRQTGGSLLLTAQIPPAAWVMNLPDLRSRIAALPMAHLATPDEALLAAVLGKHLQDRGVRAEPGVLDYIAMRMERSYAAAAHLAGVLERRSAERRQPINRALAQAVLAQENGAQ